MRSTPPKFAEATAQKHPLTTCYLFCLNSASLTSFFVSLYYKRGAAQHKARSLQDKMANLVKEARFWEINQSDAEGQLEAPANPLTNNHLDSETIKEEATEVMVRDKHFTGETQMSKD